jgi:hypothetical protein
MANLPFKINIETEGGIFKSYATASFAQTTEAGISGSTILGRINAMPSYSYSSNDDIGTLYTAQGAEFSASKNNWVSASYIGGSSMENTDTGSITFHHTDTEDTADRLKRYRFFGDKVCNVLGLPAGHWIYPVNFQLSDTAGVPNYFSGDISADTLSVANSFTMSPLASSTGNIRLNATSGSNDVFFLVSSGSGLSQKNMIQIGYDTDDDKYVIRGGTGESSQGAYIDGFSKIQAGGLQSSYWSATDDYDTRIEFSSKDITMNTDGKQVFKIDYMSVTAKRILCGDSGADGVVQGQKFDFVVHASGSSNGMNYMLNCKGEEDEGFVGIRESSPSYPLEVSQHVSNISIYAEYDIAAYSDVRVKTDIETITEPLDKVLKLRGVTFRRTDKSASDRVMMGLIAQETEPIVPEVVVTNENPKSEKRYGHKSVSYGNLTALLIEAIKEQQEQIEELKQQVKEIQDG